MNRIKTRIAAFAAVFLTILGLSVATSPVASAATYAVAYYAGDYNGGGSQSVWNVDTSNRVCATNPGYTKSIPRNYSSVFITGQHQCNSVKLNYPNGGGTLTYTCVTGKWVNFPGKYNDAPLTLTAYHSYMCP